ncbi:septal ring lytic transglycosylase RlpA family protein [Salinisphaera sp. RV14]|uniref:septal ring lytic transglycosylase RlpA family protein n=1 Tax=unclassified Salinisphaera TaxID=2649847 RepID=UPI003F85FDFD
MRPKTAVNVKQTWAAARPPARVDSQTIRTTLTALCLNLLLAACASAPPNGGHGSFPPKVKHAYCIHGHGCYHVFKTGQGYEATGQASWYGRHSAGNRTASGERFNPHAMRIASKRLPFGTWVRITNKQNGRQALAMVDDRGPYYPGRIIDGTPAVAQRLGYFRHGTAPIAVRSISETNLSAARRHAAAVDQRMARREAEHHHGHLVAEAGKFAVTGAFDVTRSGLLLGAKTSWDVIDLSGHMALGILHIAF